MSWAAANAPKPRVLGDDSSTRRSEKQSSSETVEAALARLSKGYTTAMECIGSLHKTNKLMIKEKDKGEPSNEGEALDVLMRVSRAARTTLEKAVLTDLLIQEHTPCLCQEFVDQYHPLASTGEQRRPPPLVLSSEAHKSTVRELAYLTLVNYSDLLLSCGHSHSPSKQGTVLDKGVVRKVQSLGKESCWGEESIETTQRLALAALCDASKLDGTDPIMWLKLKLACASRQLQTTVGERNPSLVLATRYRRLQRYALESGTTALPPHMPPNRAIVRARKELQEEEEAAMDQEYETPLLEDEATQVVVLELPRYSWSIFGRMLVRVCREGTDYQANPHGPKPVPKSVPAPPAFGSPAVLVKLNPMFVLPPRLLRRICGFLDTRSTVHFEMTCRGISFSMMDATAASYENEKKRKMSTSSHEEEQNEKQDVNENTTAKGGDANNEPMETDEKQEESKEKDGSKEKLQSSRTSKRLRSQQITSGKIAERQSNRKSFEYC